MFDRYLLQLCEFLGLRKPEDVKINLVGKLPLNNFECGQGEGIDGEEENEEDEFEEEEQNEESVMDIPPVDFDEDDEDLDDVPRGEEDSLVFTPEDVMAKTLAKSSDIADEADEMKFREDLDNALGMESGLDSLLIQLNISRTQFFGFILFFLGLIVLIILSFVYLFKNFGSSQEEVKIINYGNSQIEEVEKTLESVLKKEERVEKEGVWDKIKGFFEREDVDEMEKKDEKKSEKVSDKKEEKIDTTLKTVEVKMEEVKKEEVVKVGESDVSDEVSKIPAIPVASQVGKMDVGKLETRSVVMAKKIGRKEIKEGRLNYFVRTYRKVKNIYNVNLFDYLANTPDRGVAYDLYLTQFKGAFEESKLVYEELRQEIGELEDRVAKLKKDSSFMENSFFNSLDELDSEVITDKLEAFHKISVRTSLANSELKARMAIADKFKRAIPMIESRIRAIELNRDPYVKGVKIVDFEQNDLDLIIKAK